MRGARRERGGLRRRDRARLRLDLGDHAIDLGAQRGEIAGVLDHPGRGRDLVGERRLRRDPRARLVGGERRRARSGAPLAPRAAPTRRSSRRARVRAILDEQRGLVEHDVRAGVGPRRDRALARSGDARVRDAPRSARASGSANAIAASRLRSSSPSAVIRYGSCRGQPRSKPSRRRLPFFGSPSYGVE